MRQQNPVRQRTLLALAASAGAGLCLAASPAAAQLHGAVPTAPVATHGSSSPIYRVDLNKTQIVRLPTRAGTIVVGNPDIADVSVHSTDMIFVVGRGYGETNLVVLDPQGRTVMDADIQVTSVTPSHGVRVFNASNRSTYSCAPYCQPSPILGDNPEFIGANAGSAGKSEGIGALFEDLMGGMSTQMGESIGQGIAGGQPQGASTNPPF